MNPMDVALEALYVLGVLMCCALLSREEGSREGLGSRRARLFMLALAVEAMQAGLGSLAFREPWGAPFAPWQAANSADLVTFMRNQAVSPENLLRLLQNGAHAYTSTGNKEQALAMSILIGEMLSISHGRP